MAEPPLDPGFVRLQVTLVARSVELGLGSWAEGVHRLTNLQRRLGLGTPVDPPTGDWAALLDEIERLAAVEPIVDRVVAIARARPARTPEHVHFGWPTCGVFSIQADGTRARTHFYAPPESDGRSPLHPSKLDRRRHELRSVLAEAVEAHPELRTVRGGSWLYTVDRYAGLFPSAHVETATVRRGRRVFRGMSHWGQFLDHRGALRIEPAERFERNVASWNGGDPCELFPIRTLEVESPLEVFGF